MSLIRIEIIKVLKVMEYIANRNTDTTEYIQQES